LAHVADNPEQYLGKHHGESEHCVALCKHAAGLGATPTWRRGERVLGGNVPSGAVVATFTADGLYANATDGSSHAAILLEQDEAGGLRVIDQWVGHPASARTIRDKSGSGPAADDASRYWTIETEA
jgi:hypothetical protein